MKFEGTPRPSLGVSYLHILCIRPSQTMSVTYADLRPPLGLLPPTGQRPSTPMVPRANAKVSLASSRDWRAFAAALSSRPEPHPQSLCAVHLLPAPSSCVISLTSNFQVQLWPRASRSPSVSLSSSERSRAGRLQNEGRRAHLERVANLDLRGVRAQQLAVDLGPVAARRAAQGAEVKWGQAVLETKGGVA